MTYTGRQYQRADDTAPPIETNPAVVELDDDTDVQVIRIDTGTGTTPTPASASDPLPVSVQSTALPTGAATSANQALELAELQSMNLLSSVVYDEILVTYTDATKAVISKVEWKLASTVVKTLTPTFGVTTDDWVKS